MKTIRNIVDDLAAKLVEAKTMNEQQPLFDFPKQVLKPRAYPFALADDVARDAFTTASSGFPCDRFTRRWSEAMESRKASFVNVEAGILLGCVVMAMFERDGDTQKEAAEKFAAWLVETLLEDGCPPDDVAQYQLRPKEVKRLNTWRQHVAGGPARP